MSETPATDRVRLDVVLVERGITPTRVKARALILAGQVFSAGVRLEKPGQRVCRSAPIDILPGRRYVSRAAAKLVGALREFAIDPRERDAIDVGASTGGFTQVLLEEGAARVVALDVGRGQLDWSLRSDPRVHLREGINARHLEPRLLPFCPSLAVVDVSFISLALVLPAVARCLSESGEIVALVKPQFEVGRGAVGRGGVVRDASLHRGVLQAIARLSSSRGWGLAGILPAALRGAEGNQEFFVHVLPCAAGLSGPAVARIIASVTAADESGV